MQTKKYFKDFNVLYEIDTNRNYIVQSWPKSINDFAAKTDWDWKPEYSFIKAYKDYLIPHIKKYYQ